MDDLLFFKLAFLDYIKGPKMSLIMHQVLKITSKKIKNWIYGFMGDPDVHNDFLTIMLLSIATW